MVHIDEEQGVMVLTSQEKWDRMKEICRYWLAILKTGKKALEFKKLQSDQGFMVYATRAYPTMKPYLKGFHLSLEMWRGGRDKEGWKLSRASLNKGDVGREECRGRGGSRLDGGKALQWAGVGNHVCSAAIPVGPRGSVGVSS